MVGGSQQQSNQEIEWPFGYGPMPWLASDKSELTLVVHVCSVVCNGGCGASSSQIRRLNGLVGMDPCGGKSTLACISGGPGNFCLSILVCTADLSAGTSKSKPER